jgi:hypothetical protein
MFVEQEGKRREARRSQGDNEEYFSRRIAGQAVGEPGGTAMGAGKPSGPTAKTRREKVDTERGLWMSDRRRRWGGQGPRSHQRRAKSGQTFTPPRGSRAGSCAGVQPSCDHGMTGVPRVTLVPKCTRVEPIDESRVPRCLRTNGGRPSSSRRAEAAKHVRLDSPSIPLSRLGDFHR